MFSICIAGGASSGKKAVCDLIVRRLKDGLMDHSSKVAVIKLEDFYRDLTLSERVLLEKGEYNFDHPDALDFDLLFEVLEALSRGLTSAIPKWDFQQHKRIPSTTEVSNLDVILVEGNLALYSKPVRELFNLKVFVDVDSDIRLARQVIRDTEERYRKPLEEVLDNYLNFVKPAFEDFILPTKKYANVVIPRGSENSVAIGLLATHIVDILKTSNNTRAAGTILPKGVHQGMHIQ
ncbi:UNVERIFIED_CONTAM: Uridine-cytidine kinase 2 [Siphonaria sp. JEL0065]|nr:Uridine-cytidine kinase 2 [Siphonaria sp. JEL0065]